MIRKLLIFFFKRDSHNAGRLIVHLARYLSDFDVENALFFFQEVRKTRIALSVSEREDDEWEDEWAYD